MRQRAAGDHPRIRGEKLSILPIENRLIGSPPHTRGKDECRRLGRARRGITPAYAGKSSPPAGLRPRPRDHPRIRGEKAAAGRRCPAAQGSPPHTRGKESEIAQMLGRSGITPAYAGKSLFLKMRRQCRRDHPRIRGEKYSALMYRDGAWGSPPHTRGKAVSSVSCCVSPGITPAYAGKSDVVHQPAGADGDHPRIRGEKFHSHTPLSQFPGSPPHTRGKAEIGDNFRIVPGITPAYAGKRWSVLRDFFVVWDHPRIRGEKT